MHERRSRVFKKIFLWNHFFEISGGIPIGDPFFYWIIEKELSIINSKKQKINCLPRYDNSHSTSERIVNYINFISNVILTNDTDKKISIYLHPSESQTVIQEVRSEICRRNFDVVLENEGSVLNRQIQILNGSKLVSDYFGTHVFRASLLNTKVELVTTNELSQIKHLENPIIKNLLTSYSSSEEISHRREISEAILGMKHVRSREELKELLGWSGARKLLGGSVRFFYQRYQKAVW